METKVSFRVVDVSGQFSEPAPAEARPNQKPDDRQNQPGYEQSFAEGSHRLNSNPPSLHFVNRFSRSAKSMIQRSKLPNDDETDAPRGFQDQPMGAILDQPESESRRTVMPSRIEPKT